MLGSCRRNCSAGASGLYGIISASQTAGALLNENYWTNSPGKGAYEPAIRYAADTGEVNIDVVHLDYQISPYGDEMPDPIDREAYIDEINNLMSEVGLESNVSYRVIDPKEKEWLPNKAENIHEADNGGFDDGVASVIYGVNENARNSESDLISVISGFNKAFTAGAVHPEIDGICYIDRSTEKSPEHYAKVTSHEALHLLGVGHTVTDGMSNVPITQAVNSQTEKTYNGDTKSWLNGILEKFD